MLAASGCHGPYFLRNVIELRTDAGAVGLGETYGGEAVTAALEEARAVVTGRDAFAIPPVWFFTPTLETFETVLANRTFLKAFANSFVSPIRRLIHATDQVASGNFYVQVPARKSEGDLAHLAETFNKMTSELRQQHDRLTQARDLIDRRRRFTEAVLSGVASPKFHR